MAASSRRIRRRTRASGGKSGIKEKAAAAAKWQHLCRHLTARATLPHSAHGARHQASAYAPRVGTHQAPLCPLRAFTASTTCPHLPLARCARTQLLSRYLITRAHSSINQASTVPRGRRGIAPGATLRDGIGKSAGKIIGDIQHRNAPTHTHRTPSRIPPLTPLPRCAAAQTRRRTPRGIAQASTPGIMNNAAA